MSWLRVQVPPLDSASISPSHAMWVNQQCPKPRQTSAGRRRPQGWAPDPSRCLDGGKGHNSQKGRGPMPMEQPGLRSHCGGGRNPADPSTEREGGSPQHATGTSSPGTEGSAIHRLFLGCGDTSTSLSELMKGIGPQWRDSMAPTEHTCTKAERG